MSGLLYEVCGEWTLWFAWHPVCVDGRWVWLRPLARRRVSVSVIGDVYGRPMSSSWSGWEYRS